MNNKPVIVSTSWSKALSFAHEKGMSSSGFIYVDHPDKLRGMRGKNIVIYVRKEDGHDMEEILQRAQLQQLTVRVV